MKLGKLNLLVSSALLSFCGAIAFSSCSDKNEDINDKIVDPVLEESYMNESLMDRAVNPGDSFYDFALGTWLRNHTEDDSGLQYNVAAKQEDAYNLAFLHNNDPLVQHLLQHANKPMNIQEMRDFIKSLIYNGQDNGENLTREMFLNTLARLVDLGYTPLVKRTVTTDNGLFVKVLTAGKPNEDLLNSVEIEEPLAIYYIFQIFSVEVDDPDFKKWVEIAKELLKIEKTIEGAYNELYADDLNLRNTVRPVRAKKVSELTSLRYAANEGLTQADVLHALGMEGNYCLVDEKIQPVMELILTEDVELLYRYLMLNLYEEMSSFAKDEEDDDFDDIFLRLNNDVSDNETETTVLDSELYELLKNVSPELLSRIEYPLLDDRMDIEGCRDMLEQMRTLMEQRINNLDWMSDATKNAAKEKLTAMGFNIGKPDKRPGMSLTLTGENMLEDILQLRQQRQKSLMELVGKSTNEYAWDYVLQFYNIGLFNAVYVPTLNDLFIFPAFICQELFPKDNETMRYATSVVFGHELCHGFDANGSQYDALGTIHDWWSEADKIQFKQKQEKMVNLYNQLYQYGQVHANGELTLNENMADMGGVRLAFELYRKKLTDAGRTQEEINHYLREFFLHYALLWENNPSEEELISSLKDDDHSTNANRINGVTRLMDEWYSLFQVNNGKWYLSPEERVTIW